MGKPSRKSLKCRRFRLSRGSFKPHLSWLHQLPLLFLQQRWQLPQSAMALQRLEAMEPQWLEAMELQWSVGMAVTAQVSSVPQPSSEDSIGRIAAFRSELDLVQLHRFHYTILELFV